MHNPDPFAPINNVLPSTRQASPAAPYWRPPPPQQGQQPGQDARPGQDAWPGALPQPSAADTGSVVDGVSPSLSARAQQAQQQVWVGRGVRFAADKCKTLVPLVMPVMACMPVPASYR